MDRPTDLMQPPSNRSDPRATAVHFTGDTAALPSIAGYQILKKLGHGGMATVYMATQISLDRAVSIKVMERDTLSDETSMQRFENEARTIAKLSHPNIVAIYEVGRTDDGRMYYSMPYMPNGDLAQRDLGKEEAGVIELLRTLLSALDYAHTRGVVHRDVKQENVLFDAENRPLLADFGIAISKNDDVRITTAGLAVGSSGYMAPEQARGDAVDARADLYSVGVLAYELLTGELPFRSNDALALALMHAQKEIPRLPPAKRHWQSFIDKAMAKSPDQRYANAKEMLEGLDRIGRRSGNHISQRVMRTIDRTGEPGWKRSTVFAVAALLLAGGLYAARDHLPGIGSGTPATPATPVASAPAGPAVSPTSTSASPVPSPGGTVASPTASTPTAPAATSNIPPAASEPAPATPAPPAPPPSSAPTSAAASIALGNARAALARGNLIAPAGKNAVDLALAAWELAPAVPDSRSLVGDVMKDLSGQEVQAITQHNDARAAQLQQKATVLDNATIGPSASAWKSLHAATTNALLARRKRESGDPAAQAQTQSLASQLGMSTPGTTAPAGPQSASAPAAPTLPGSQSGPANQQKQAAGTGTAMDPGFVKLHAAIGPYPAAAIATHEVTRREYEAFVNATHRAASDCVSPRPGRSEQDNQSDSNQQSGRFGQGSRVGRFGRGSRGAWNQQNAASQQDQPAGPQRTWIDPGFAQGKDHPVVCVNWNDAHAYTQWLGERRGHRYRLASFREWQLATAGGVGSTGSTTGTVSVNSGPPNSLGLYGVGGNVSEWLEECASLKCDRHQVAGRSWRNRGMDLLAAGRMTDRAFDDVGFRVVEILDGSK